MKDVMKSAPRTTREGPLRGEVNEVHLFRESFSKMYLRVESGMGSSSLGGSSYVISTKLLLLFPTQPGSRTTRKI